MNSFAMAFFLTLFLTLFWRCVYFVLVNYWTLYGAAGELAMEVKASRPEEVLIYTRREGRNEQTLLLLLPSSSVFFLLLLTIFHASSSRISS